jgi:hypothetical protein
MRSLTPLNLSRLNLSRPCWNAVQLAKNAAQQWLNAMLCMISYLRTLSARRSTCFCPAAV